MALTWLKRKTKMNTLHIDDLSRAADKLTKDKIEKVTPVPISQYEKWLLETVHVLSLPTIGEIYKEICFEILKWLFYIGVFLVVWNLLSAMLDMIFA